MPKTTLSSTYILSKKESDRMAYKALEVVASDSKPCIVKCNKDLFTKYKYSYCLQQDDT